MVISRPERPRSGMYLLDEDLAMDAEKRRALLPNDPEARFVLGGAGTEVSRALVDRLTNVEITDRHVRIQKGKAPAAPPPEPPPTDEPQTGFADATTTVTIEEAAATEPEPEPEHHQRRGR